MGEVGHEGVGLEGGQQISSGDPGEWWPNGKRGALRGNGGRGLRPSSWGTVNFVRRSGIIGLEWGMGVGSGSPDHGGAARKNTSTEGSLPQKCFREMQSRSFWMAVDLRTMGPGGWNSLAGNLQWKNGVGSDPALRPQAPVCRLLRGGGAPDPGL